MESLIVWDFDLSLLSEINTDTYIVKHFSRQVYEDELCKDGQWTDMMSKSLSRLHSEHGITHTMIEKAFEKVSFGMAQKVAELRDSSVVKQIIVSDANDFFISCFLKREKIFDAFDLVATNPTEISAAGKISVKHYHRNATCTHCPVNLCKARVLNEYLEGKKFQKIIYIGDGSGDYHACSMSMVTPLARKGFALEKLLLKNGKKCVAWENEEHLKSLIDEQLKN